MSDKEPQEEKLECEIDEHDYQFSRCHLGEEIYKCTVCEKELRQYADQCSGG